MGEPFLTEENSPIDMIIMGLDMIRAVDQWSRNLNTGVVVTCRVGIACGEVIGGIVGTDMQRYHLFGPAMGVMEVLECTSLEARVQVDVACKEEVERQLRETPKAVKDREKVYFEQ